MIVLVCYPFSVDGLLDDLLRGLCVRRENESASIPAQKNRAFSLPIFSTAFVRQKLPLFDAGDLPNSWRKKPEESTR